MLEKLKLIRFIFFFYFFIMKQMKYCYGKSLYSSSQHKYVTSVNLLNFQSTQTTLGHEFEYLDILEYLLRKLWAHFLILIWLHSFSVRIHVTSPSGFPKMFFHILIYWLKFYKKKLLQYTFVIIRAILDVHSKMNRIFFTLSSFIFIDWLIIFKLT